MRFLIISAATLYVHGKTTAERLIQIHIFFRDSALRLW